MPAKRRARRRSDPGLQPERTALAWYRTLLSCVVLITLLLRQQQMLSGTLFTAMMAIVISLWLIVCGFPRKRGRMDITCLGFADGASRTTKLAIALLVSALSLAYCSQLFIRLLPAAGSLS